MIKVSVLYPNGPETSFDMDYYLNRHLPMVQSTLGPSLLRVTAEEGLGGGAPGDPATYRVMGHLYFESVDAFQAAFGPHAESLLGDIPNYTNAEPVMQVSEIRL